MIQSIDTGSRVGLKLSFLVKLIVRPGSGWPLVMLRYPMMHRAALSFCSHSCPVINANLSLCALSSRHVLQSCLDELLWFCFTLTAIIIGNNDNNSYVFIIICLFIFIAILLLHIKYACVMEKLLDRLCFLQFLVYFNGWHWNNQGIEENRVGLVIISMTIWATKDWSHILHRQMSN